MVSILLSICELPSVIFTVSQQPHIYVIHHWSRFKHTPLDLVCQLVMPAFRASRRTWNQPAAASRLPPPVSCRKLTVRREASTWELKRLLKKKKKSIILLLNSNDCIRSGENDLYDSDFDGLSLVACIQVNFYHD